MAAVQSVNIRCLGHPLFGVWTPFLDDECQVTFPRFPSFPHMLLSAQPRDSGDDVLLSRSGDDFRGRMAAGICMQTIWPRRVWDALSATVRCMTSCLMLGGQQAAAGQAPVPALRPYGGSSPPSAGYSEGIFSVVI